jgi:hypothetical protein
MDPRAHPHMPISAIATGVVYRSLLPELIGTVLAGELVRIHAGSGRSWYPFDAPAA